MSEPRWSMEGVPTRPGVYLFRNEEGAVLYVGKARSLRQRLFSYRRPGGDGRLGVWFLEREAASVETIVTRTEAEALLLEDTLIKQHKPPYNVRLKDDKSFLMIRVDLDERWPRLKFVRAHRPDERKGKGRSRYFGPFASARSVRKTMSDLHRVVPLRDCTDNVLENRSRPCLKHQIGLCSAPCVGLVSKDEYATLVEKAIEVLAGETAELERDLETRMQAAAEKLEFELAAQWRDRLTAVRRTVERQGVRAKDTVERDVLAFVRRGEWAVVHRLAFREGRMTESRSHRFKSRLPDEELLHNVLTALYAPGRREAPRELVLPCQPADVELFEDLFASTQFVVPSSGERQRMLDIAAANARAELERATDDDEQATTALEQLAKLLDLDPSQAPEVIDCFDVSNMQGSNVVASRVRFRGGLADRGGYRRFKVRTVEGQDDFASMAEVVGRSLRRGLDEDDLPDLIVVDGGQQQLAVALQAREDAGAFDVPIVGIAKARAERTIGKRRVGRSEERLVLAPDIEPIELPRHSAVRHLLERIRDEAHRFAITYHRKERGRITSRLDSIPGVGEAKRKALLRAFGSVVGVKQASVEQIGALPSIGPKLAQVIVDHLHDRSDPQAPSA
ncbi:excinuclease ABC subunit UvrC [Engelhardtia mirabilis]|uniref:UvrABC system protein C n=1 Tax=Engelhardtia mirabilis TaxID=2528011 RepID=A0A518BLS5_9BACT|nr:UvrABC system protein C [Planctomycetes bacterium Pla133]QDV02246.1 UvrABC system protein C [Planctomycetes bacterium Pla86]